MSKSVLLLSAYDATSHRYWRDGITSMFPQFRWTQLTLADRHFYWRVRGNALSFADKYREQLSQCYDLIIATSMVDLNNLLGFFPHLAATPKLLYFHENQFVYPQQQEANNNIINAQLTSIYSAIAAEQLVFNSNFNRKSFLDGVAQLSKKLPDGIPRNLVGLFAEKSTVVPVALNDDLSSSWIFKEKDNQLTSKYDASNNKGPVTILWNHRWEYDKNPETFFNALYLLEEAGVKFNVNVLGQQFRKQPAIFAEARRRLSSKIIKWGFLPRADYLETLLSSDIVISSSFHEFQGISMLEAMACGCLAIAPDDLVYPEYVTDDCRYQRLTCSSQATNEEGQSESAVLASLIKQKIENISCNKQLALEQGLLVCKVFCPETVKRQLARILESYLQ